MNDKAAYSTSDNLGVQYGERLKRMREARNLSPESIASQLSISLQEYLEWEDFEGELNYAATLGELLKLSGVLKIPLPKLFDDEVPAGSPIPLSMLGRLVSQYLQNSGTDLSQFEEQVGWSIEASLTDPTRVLEWNIDCLRSVCFQMELDWRLVVDTTLT
jgi:transcriptional regulator with XRE-family HTH domain